MISHYLVSGWHALRRRPLVTAINLFGIVITLIVLLVGAALVDAELNPSGPERAADEMLYITRLSLESERQQSTGEPGYPFLKRYLEGVPGEHAVYAETVTDRVFIDDLPVDLEVRYVEPSYWRVLDFEPLAGRLFDADEAGRAVAVISATKAEEIYGSIDAVGETLDLGETRFRIGAVVPDVSRLERTAYAHLWLPLAARTDRDFLDLQYGGFNALIRSPDGAVRQAAAERYAANIANYQPHEGFEKAVSQTETKLQMTAREYLQRWQEQEAPAVAEILAVGVAGLLVFMALPALNLINLNLSRIWERREEVGLRKAMGARATDLIGQLLIENLVLAGVGFVLAVVLSLGVFATLAQTDWLGETRLALNPTVITAGLIFALLFGVLSGVVPAWRTARMNPASALKGVA